MSDDAISAAVRQLARRDPRLRPWIARYGHPPLTRTRNAFASLGRAIIYQQLSGKAAGTIFRRFVALYPGRRFPPPEMLAGTPIDALRAVGLSGQKATYLLDLADKFASKTISARRLLHASDDEVRVQLTQVKGIGHWSVDMFLIFGLVRLDVLPVGDLGVRKGMAAYFGLRELPKPEQMLALAASWQPARSLASWYMWRVAESL